MDYQYEYQHTAHRILERLQRKKWSKAKIEEFDRRLDEHFPHLFKLLIELYGHHYDTIYYIERLIQALADAFNAIAQRTDDLNWYESEQTVGMAVYVDQFSDDLKTLGTRIDYLKSLGVNYLHLMPLYKSPPGNSDGGYAVSDYREVNPKLGTTADLKALADKLHTHGIRMVLDFVFNHTSNEHEWAQQAEAGDKRFQEFYYLFEQKEQVDQLNTTVREIFPQSRRGSFTYNEKMQCWVWTTFNSFQWDLNYSNPDVFVSITEEMLFLASLGCDVLRLDALAFIWKEFGTTCENLPKAHSLIKAFTACLNIAAPHVMFKSEAIVHPDEVNKYISEQECKLSYNPLMMALMWEALATRETRLLSASLQKSFQIPQSTTWVNYLRCHDDIGWTWDDDIAARMGINGYDHRLFLNRFYTGQFEGSFASGVAFQENPSNGDCRVCGSLASLAGIEKALAQNNELELHLALSRINMMNAVNLAMPGIPLLYQGDDLGVLNDFAYLNDPNKADDARWVNRKHLTPDDFKRAQDLTTAQGRIATELSRLIHLRKSRALFSNGQVYVFNPPNKHCLSIIRYNGHGAVWILANFSEHHLQVDLPYGDVAGKENWTDILSDKALAEHVMLEPYQCCWFAEG
ncbi:MAG: alpha-amylase family protein [Reinekea sp.]|jgi:amylosucrase